MHKRKDRKLEYESKDTSKSYIQASDGDPPEYDPFLFIVAYEADIVGGPRAVSAALAL
ncbi:hypothetical protein V8B97DRAFT_2012746, partial [Scleroderma yunnanense]